jgi:hypothetical protein
MHSRDSNFLARALGMAVVVLALVCGLAAIGALIVWISI